MYPWLHEAWAKFLDRLDTDRLAHAILLQGPAGTGKRALASQMAGRLLCTDAGDYACGECRSCKLYASGAHPDWFPLAPGEGKHQIVIDAVRDTARSLTFTTTISTRKVAMICPAEAMNIHASNALLKSLEEPPGETVIILVAHDASRLPVTIRSRCQAMTITPPDPGEALQWLCANAGLDEVSASAALAAAGGSPLRAAEYAKDGLVEEYAALRRGLAGLWQSPDGVSAVAAEFGEVDEETLWYWLSTSVADTVRGFTLKQEVEWLGDVTPPDIRALGRLQQTADRNRMLARTSVRQDLLIEEWLIKWAALAA